MSKQCEHGKFGELDGECWRCLKERAEKAEAALAEAEKREEAWQKTAGRNAIDLKCEQDRRRKAEVVLAGLVAAYETACRLKSGAVKDADGHPVDPRLITAREALAPGKEVGDV